MHYKVFARSWLLLLPVFVLACSKDDDNNEPSGQEILTSGQWTVTGAVANPPLTIPGIGSVSDVYPYMPPCYKDNIYVFDKNGTAAIDEGAVKCNTGDPQSSTVTWALSADEKQLTIDGNTFTVVELAGNRMRLNGTVEVQSTAASGELTFTK